MGESNNYFWSFSTYDRALNRPFVYLLYFSYAGESRDGDGLREDSDTFSEIRSAAESGALGRIGLLGFANGLDYKVDRISPKIVKRLIIGPYWAPQLTTAEGEIGELLESFADRLPFAMRWETETLLSERETQVGATWFSKGQTPRGSKRTPGLLLCGYGPCPRMSLWERKKKLQPAMRSTTTQHVR